MKAILTAVLIFMVALVAVAQDRMSYGIEVDPQLSPGISYRGGANFSIPLRGKLVSIGVLTWNFNIISANIIRLDYTCKPAVKRYMSPKMQRRQYWVRFS